MKRFFLGFVISLGWQLVTPAQPATDPVALTALRQRYQGLSTEVETTVRNRLLGALEGQEKKGAAAGDYEGAAQWHQRKTALLSGNTPPADVLRGGKSLVLSAQAARTATAVDFLDAKKEVARFRRIGSLMEWELPSQVPGSYQVNLVCGVTGSYDLSKLPDPYKDPTVPLPLRPTGALVGGEGGGVVEFRKLTSLKEGGALLRCSVRSTGGWTKERTLTLGRVELDSRIVKFSLRAVDAMPVGVMDFRRIELVPLAVQGGAGADPEGVREFSRLREVYQKQFTDQTRASTVKYLKDLSEIEMALAKEKDSKMLGLVRQEKQQLEQQGKAVIPLPAPILKSGAPDTSKSPLMVNGDADQREARASGLCLLLARYADELVGLQKKCLEAGDSASAARVQLERDRITPALGLSEVATEDAEEFAAFEEAKAAPAGAQPTVLAPSGALEALLKIWLPPAPTILAIAPPGGTKPLTSPVRFTRRLLKMTTAQLQNTYDPAYGYWSWTIGRSVSWTLSDLPSGSYKLQLRYACDDVQGGGKLNAKFGNTSMEAEVLPTGTWKRKRDLLIGPFDITDERADLVLTPIKVRPGAYFLMDLAGVMVLPAGAATGP